MRSQSVTIAGKDIVIREMKIKDIKANLLPKIEPFWETLSQTDVVGIVDCLGEQIQDIFPELQGIDIEECYPSELEAFVEAWTDVNFTGLKRLLGPLLSLVKQGLPKLG
jgi:hypothetical protein